MSAFASRRKKLRKGIRKAKVDALLVTDFINVSYLTGFTGDDSYLLVTVDDELLLSDPRYTTQLEEECPDLKLAIRDPGVQMLESVTAAVEKKKIDKLGVEGGSMTLTLQAGLSEALPQVQTITTTDLVEGLRVLKDRTEIEDTRVACEQARRAYEVVRALITPQMSELEVAAELEYQARRFGAQALSFPPIVAVGARSALPHARPGNRLIGEDNFTLIDWGACTGRYMSDLTRIIVTGKISPKLRKIYGIVLDAQLAGIAAIRPGVSCEKVDHAARRVIEKAGYGDSFGHGLGHGLGLQIHESPRLARNQDRLLEPGMIVTVEPGIYLPGWGGVRIEDDILVTRNGHEVLTSVAKQLEDCVVG